ncbi:restriction endonuclease [Vibrio parahaemolyticus]|nr:restriction endonuclease [Vibrio parahaemolyticus]
MTLDNLEPGTKLDNAALCECFGCSPQGGMRRAHKTNSLVLISNHVKSIYDDRWDNDVLLYTGMGTKLNQSLEFAQNKTLAESPINGVNVHLFEVFKDKEYTYVGPVGLCGTPYLEQQMDENGDERQVYIFPLKLSSGEHRVSLDDQHSLAELKQKQAARLSDDKLKQRAQLASRKAGERNN